MNNSDFFGPGGGGGGGGGGGAAVPPFVRACSLELVGFRGASSEIRLVSHISDEVPESKFGRRKCSVVGIFEVI